MEQKRPADIFQELLDYLWNGLGLEEKGWKRLKKGDFKKKMKNELILSILLCLNSRTTPNKMTFQRESGETGRKLRIAPLNKF